MGRWVLATILLLVAGCDRHPIYSKLAKQAQKSAQLAALAIDQGDATAGMNYVMDIRLSLTAGVDGEPPPTHSERAALWEGSSTWQQDLGKQAEANLPRLMQAAALDPRKALDLKRMLLSLDRQDLALCAMPDGGPPNQ